MVVVATHDPAVVDACDAHHALDDGRLVDHTEPVHLPGHPEPATEPALEPALEPAPEPAPEQQHEPEQHQPPAPVDHSAFRRPPAGR